VNCATCKAEFHRPPTSGTPRKYCGDKCKSKARPRTEKRRDAERASRIKHAASHPEHRHIRLLWQRKWRKENREQSIAHIQNYRAKKKGAGGSYSVAEWKALLDATGHQCLCCRKTDVKLTVDHVIPVSLGGTSDIGNIQPLCGRCNSRKSNRTLDFRVISENNQQQPRFAATKG
jgi:5-methylcytosine-specific restriction endonuclease McrA